MKYEYDPIKILNKTKFLNDAAIKCRYDLMNINRFYDSKGIKFKKNLFLPFIYNQFDKDILDYGNKKKNSSYKDLKSKAELIIDKIHQSSIIEKLNNVDQTAMGALGLICNAKKIKHHEIFNVLKYSAKDFLERTSNDKLNFEILDEADRENTDSMISNRHLGKIKIDEAEEVEDSHQDNENLFAETHINFNNFNFFDQGQDNPTNLYDEKRNPFAHVQKILKLKKPKTRNIINNIDTIITKTKHKVKNVSKSVIFIEENNSGEGSPYETSNILKTANNYRLNDFDNFKSDNNNNKFISNSTKSIYKNSFKSIIFSKENSDQISSKFKNISSKSVTPSLIDEYSVCTYNNTKHLVKNFLLDGEQMEIIEDKSKRKLKITRRKITSKNLILGNSAMNNDKITLSDLLLVDNAELNQTEYKNEKDVNICHTVQAVQNAQISQTPKNSDRNLFTIKNSPSSKENKIANFLKSSQENNIKLKGSSKFKETDNLLTSSSPKVEKFFDFVKSLEKTVKFENERKPKATFRKKVIINFRLNGKVLDKFTGDGTRRGFVKNVKNVRYVKKSGKSNLIYEANIKSVEDNLSDFNKLK